MNALIETLNAWAEHALHFAWPMLWQSSLLIGLLFVLDLLFKRRLRPAVRYTLWLVVLVKLLLPPSLALPTSAGWWLRPAKIEPATPRPSSVVVTYDASDLPALPSVAPPTFVAPSRPRLSPLGWALVGTITVSLGLLAWLLARWRRVALNARHAAPAPACLCGLPVEWPQQRIPLRLTDWAQSPAVCGLFRPVILLPRSLAERLPPAQLRAVLLHELVHLRRGDVWVNCAQALLQIVYWWHPLLWLANARIRRVREEAVDDAVMLALKEDAETYAPTLLEVAKLALHRPLASLGLVGILESRSSLRQRIERLMDFRPPRKAGLTLGSALAVLGFAALAVPMGEARAPSEVTQSPASPLTTNNLVSDGLSSSRIPGEHQPLYIRTFRINEDTLVEGLHVPLDPVATNGWEAIFHALLDHLSQAGVDLDPVRNPGKAVSYSDRSGMLMVRATLKDLDIVERKLAALRAAAGNEPAPGTVSESPLSPVTTNGSVPNGLSSPSLPAEQKAETRTLVQDGKLLYEMGKLDEADAKLKLALKEDPNNKTALYYLKLVADAKHPRATELHKANTRPESLPVPKPFPRTNLVYTSQGRQTLISKLDRIRLDSVKYDGLPLGEVIIKLSDEARKRDPDKHGINFLINQGLDTGGAPAPTTPQLGPDGNPLPTPPPEQVDVSAIPIKINPPLTNIRLADVLDAIVKVAEHPIKYSIEDYAVVFSVRGREINPLYVRTFKVDPNTLLEGLHLAKGQAWSSGVEKVAGALRDYFVQAGVDLDPIKHPGKALFFNDRQGMLVVRATLEDLDIIEAAIPVLNYVPPQITLKVKVVAVPQSDPKALGFDWYLGSVLMTNGSTGPETGSGASSNREPAPAKPPGAFPAIPHAGTTNEPGEVAHSLPSGRRTGDSTSFTLSGILTDPQFRTVIKALEQRQGVELVSQLGAVVISGRQVQCKTTDTHSLVRINERALKPPGMATTNDDESSFYVTEPMECGVTLDVRPTVLEDGYTIRMPVIGTVVEFLGYGDARTNRVAVYVNGRQKWLHASLPIFRTQQMSSTLNVYEGQTLVLGGLLSERTAVFKDQVPVLGDLPWLGRLFRREGQTTEKRSLLIFITPTIIDPAGNRVHSDNDLPFTRDAIPRQPPR
jgi:beta-lactamase regulating signal transducer with metallopeptidase domain